MFYDQAVSSNPAEKLLKEALVWLQPSGIEGESGEDAGSGVTAWRNSGTGGSAYDLNDVAGGVTVGTIGSNRSVRFDGVNGTHLRRDSVVIPQPFSVMVVWRFSAMGTTQYLFGGRTTTALECAVLSTGSDGNVRMYGPTAALTGFIAVADTTYAGVFSFQGTQSQWTINAASGGNDPGTADWRFGTIGSSAISSSINVTNGDIGEMGVFSRALDSSERSLLVNHLLSVWA